MQLHDESAYKSAMRFRMTRSLAPAPPWEKYWKPPGTSFNTIGITMAMGPSPCLAAKPKQIAKRLPDPARRMEPATKKHRIPWPKALRDTDAERTREVARWMAFIDFIGPDNCGAAVDFVNAESNQQAWRIVDSICRNRAVPTLRNRAGAIGAYVKWMQGERLPPFSAPGTPPMVILVLPTKQQRPAHKSHVLRRRRQVRNEPPANLQVHAYVRVGQSFWRRHR